MKKIEYQVYGYYKPTRSDRPVSAQKLVMEL